MFGDRWLGVRSYNSNYDKTVESMPSNVKEAQRRAEEDYSPCRDATEKLRRILYGKMPGHRNAVRATLLASTGKMIPIKADVWGADDALKIFRTSRIKYNSGNSDFVPLSTREAAGIIEGRIIISRRDLESRLGLAGKPPRRRAAPQQEAAAQALGDLCGEPSNWPGASMQLLKRVNRWLEERKLGSVSMATLKRATSRK